MKRFLPLALVLFFSSCEEPTPPQEPSCGDAVLDTIEECDDGNFASGDGCNIDCRIESCGNATIDPGEVCDDGNLISGDGCRSDCKQIETCGNQLLDIGEECDDGNNNNSDACLDSCALARCGDGFVHDGIEPCDDGNVSEGDGCDSNCTLTACGNQIFSIGELCLSLPQPIALGTGGIIGVADLNGDTLDDLIALSPNSLLVRINEGQATFGSVLPFIADDASFAFVAGDFNGDSFDDVAVTRNRSSSSFEFVTSFLSSGDAVPSFVPFTSQTGRDIDQLSPVDIDSDQDLDLVARGPSKSPELLLNDGSGAFPARQNIFLASQLIGQPTHLVGDWNSDGIPDLAVGFGDHPTIVFVTNQGNLQFQSVSLDLSTFFERMLSGDFDEDGDLDILIATQSTTILRLSNDGAGNFSVGAPLALGTPRFSNVMQSADFNLDGHLDLVIGFIDESVQFFLGQGDFTFIQSEQFFLEGNLFGTVVTEVNGDGLPDLLVSSIGEEVGALLLSTP